MKILITETGEIINQSYIRNIKVKAYVEHIDVSFYLSYKDEHNNFYDKFFLDEDICPTFAEELLKEIIIDRCTRDVIDMREVKKIFEHRIKVGVIND